MNKEQAKEAAKVMLAYADGAEIEVLHRQDKHWRPKDEPIFDWYNYNYRVRPPRKPSINWDHVDPKFNWLFIYRNGDAVLTEEEPGWLKDTWQRYGKSAGAMCFSSFDAGNCDWKDSKVRRPE